MDSASKVTDRIYVFKKHYITYLMLTLRLIIPTLSAEKCAPKLRVSLSLQMSSGRRKASISVHTQNVGACGLQID